MQSLFHKNPDSEKANSRHFDSHYAHDKKDAAGSATVEKKWIGELWTETVEEIDPSFNNWGSFGG